MNQSLPKRTFHLNKSWPGSSTGVTLQVLLYPPGGNPRTWGCSGLCSHAQISFFLSTLSQ